MPQTHLPSGITDHFLLMTFQTISRNKTKMMNTVRMMLKTFHLMKTKRARLFRPVPDKGSQRSKSAAHLQDA